MKIKTLALAAMLSTALVGIAQAAEKSFGTFSGTIGFTTDYRFRGISQTDENMAVQGSFDWAHDSGVYAGIWGSNVDFNDGDEANIETDVYGGLKKNWAGLGFDFGLLGYLYPGAGGTTNYDYWEAKVAVSRSFGDVGATLSGYYSPDFFNQTGDATYLGLGLSVPFRDTDFTGLASIGNQWIEDEVTYGAPDYMDWSLGVGYKWNGFDMSLKYIDTNLSNAECFSGLDWCDATGIFSISRTM